MHINKTIKSHSYRLLSIYTAWKVSKYGVISGPYLHAFGQNTDRYEVSLRVQYEKVRSISSCPVRIRENTNQKLFRIWALSTQSSLPTTLTLHVLVNCILITILWQVHLSRIKTIYFALIKETFLEAWKIIEVLKTAQPQEVFCQKCVLKNFTNFTGKHLANLRNFKNIYFEEHLRTTASANRDQSNS